MLSLSSASVVMWCVIGPFNARACNKSLCGKPVTSNLISPVVRHPATSPMNFSRCKTRRGGVARPCTLFTSRLHTRPHSVTIRFATGSLAIGRTVASATATASDPPQAAIAAALLWELNALPFDHDTTTRLPKKRLPTSLSSLKAETVQPKPKRIRRRRDFTRPHETDRSHRCPSPTSPSPPSASTTSSSRRRPIRPRRGPSTS